jgi:hypothetical protein
MLMLMFMLVITCHIHAHRLLSRTHSFFINSSQSRIHASYFFPPLCSAIQDARVTFNPTPHASKPMFISAASPTPPRSGDANEATCVLVDQLGASHTPQQVSDAVRNGVVNNWESEMGNY